MDAFPYGPALCLETLAPLSAFSVGICLHRSTGAAFEAHVPADAREQLPALRQMEQRRSGCRRPLPRTTTSAIRLAKEPWTRPG